MKYLVASDIHGSLYYTKELINVFKSDKFDKLILLGDILYHGPRNPLPRDYNTKEVVILLNEIADDIICVKGNCDSEVDQMVLDFNISTESLLLTNNNQSFYFTHGHKISKNNLNINTDFLVNGHFHIPCIEECNNFIYLNPGSISLPKEDSANSYMIIDDNNILIKDFLGNTLMCHNR